MAAWRDAAEAMRVPYDEELSVHQQSAGYTRHERWDFEATRARRVPAAAALPLLRPLPQAGGQAGRPGAGDGHVRRSLHAREEKARAFAYYEPLTVRDSSLSACVQAIVAAEVGHLELAFDYFGEAALMDLDDLEHNTRDGLHMASLAGSWLAAVAGFGGFRDHEGAVLASPRGCRRTSSAWPSGSCCAAGGCASRSCRARRATS